MQVAVRGAAAEQPHFAEERAAAEVGQDDFAAGMLLGDFHEPDAHQVEASAASPCRTMTSPGE